MNSVPLVSIVIPAYNPRFFQTALASALTQTYERLEVIVCDDSPGSEIREIVDTLTPLSNVELRYVRNPQRLGFVGNLLQCLAQAQGEYVKFLCDDDRLFPGCITLQAQAFVANPDANLVLAQRFLWDADSIQLPSRLENTPVAPKDSLFLGTDMLAIFENFPSNFLGSFTSAMFRRADIQELLPALTGKDQGFAAMLDLALYTCLLRRGNLIVLNQVLSVERLHPERLSRQQAMRIAAANELTWLVDMLKARTSEPPPAQGWVRYVELDHAERQPRVWEELALSRTLGSQQAVLPLKVGVDSQSFAELYAQWLSCRTFNAHQQALLPDRLRRLPVQPKIVAVVIDEHGSSARRKLTLDSLAEQFYPAELTVMLTGSVTEPVLEERLFKLPLQADWADQLNGLLPQLEGADWFYLLRAGDRLVAPALLTLADRIANAPQVRCFYSDEGALREGESAEPVFKPAFNLDFLRSYPYVGRVLAFERQRFIALGGFDAGFGELAPHDVIWRLVENDGAQSIGHIADLLVESQFALGQWLISDEVIEHNPRVVQAHLQRCGIEHHLRQGNQPLLNRIDYEHAQQPLVSIIVSHRNQLAALQRCFDSLLEKTAYPHYELLIVDNGSDSAEALGWLEGLANMGSATFRVLYSGEVLSPTALRNLAGQHARGEYLLMLNPYAVVTQDDWLGELMNHAQRPEVGVVSGKLFDASGAIVHAGVILGLQNSAATPFYGESLDAAGYMQRLQVVQDLSAVGPDCLLVRRSVFEHVGALDAEAFADSFSEVDLCLRVREQGYLVVWTPFSVMALGAAPVKTRDDEAQQRQTRELEALYLRWLPIIARDPAYNPSLTLDAYSFRLDPGLRTGWSPFSERSLPSVLALPMNATAVGHYRVTQPFIELSAADRIIGQIAYDAPTTIELERRSPDVIVLQGRYHEASMEDTVRLKTFSNARRIFELDDYVISVPKKNAHGRHMPTNLEAVVKRGISLCDRVVVSTHALGNALSSMHHDIRVVPNMLAPHLWTGRRAQRRTSFKPRVGWGGGTSHGGDLEIIADVIRQLADEVDWVFFGMCPADLRPFLKEFHPAVSLEAYPAKLSSLNLDLALAPLEYHIFNDCKSNLRLLEYGACGYPVICTDTEAYRGYLPCTRLTGNTTEEWLEAIRMHLADPQASYRMGDELHEVVMRDFMLRGDNLQYWVNGWLAD
ncbi:glycosyltransferase [Pseudomonas sp. ME-P-057]|uniref:glycosyltransferase n=1 Tax=Pseudomonas sp. ME-P-057 TaxID=3040321 RepID=UPI002556095F|nr:glycosyltransferase [Pseudomonas sp. ME-P-057]